MVKSLIFRCSIHMGGGGLGSVISRLERTDTVTSY